ncbi:MAG: EamA family transporter [Alphaproteobacteria bacterium]
MTAAANPGRNRWLGMVCLGAVAFTWGGQWPLVALSLREIDPVSLRALMVVPAGVLLLAVCAIWRQPMRVGGADFGWLVLFGLLNVTAFQLCATFGVQLMNVGRAIILAYTTPLWIAVIERVWLGQRLTRRRAVALALGGLALICLLGQDLSSMRNAPLGALLTLSGAAIFGIATILMQRHPVPISPIASGGWQLLLGGAPLLVLGLVLQRTDITGIPAQNWVMLAWMSVIGMGLGYTCWFVAVGTFAPVVCGIGSLASPVVGVLGGVIVLGDPLGWREAAALALVCVAVMLVMWPGDDLPAPPEAGSIAPKS